MLNSKYLVGYFFVGSLSLFALNLYFAGGRCTITKDLSNDIAVITGGNTGIGKGTVHTLSELGCTVIIGARDTHKSEKVVHELSKMKGNVIQFQLDLSCKKSIEQFAQKVKKQLNGKPINYLINNAGVMRIPQKKITKEGFQMQMGVNHFGHFYLTYLLWDSLKKCQHPRIINVSSRAHRNRDQLDNIDFDDINYERTVYQPSRAYSHSKKANILFSSQLQRRMNYAKVKGLSMSLHPGVVRTQIGRDMINSVSLQILFMVLYPFGLIFMKSSEQGAQTTLYTILEKEQKLKGGEYYSDCEPSKLLAQQCKSQDAAKKLWDISEKLLNIKFDI